MNNYQDCLDYIDGYWKELTCNIKKDTAMHIGLPNPFVSPNGKIFNNDQFYWDSFFIILGLIPAGKVQLAKGMVDNFVFLYKKYGIVPARNRYWNLGISQPPFLTSMALEVFAETKDKKWLRSVTQIAEKELHDFWMYDGKDGEKAEIRMMYKGLSRYADHNITHATAEHESGWDMTSRFKERCLDILPIDLNCLLYKYEMDLVEIYTLLGNEDKVAQYKKQAKARKKAIQELMWNEQKGFFFDYDHFAGKQMSFYSLAGFYPLWVGVATDEQAEILRRKLRLFETDGGLANTQKHHLSKQFKQWDYPNGWANQQWIVIEGLRRYGFVDDAKRLAKKWMDLNALIFRRDHVFYEKYNVVDMEPGKTARYPNQEGFGWTNAVFLRLYTDLFSEQ